MNKPANIPYHFIWSQQFPHIAEVDLGKGFAVEVAVMAIDARNGDLYFMQLNQMDSIDLKRMRNIILSRDSARYALWDLMDQKTLPNGVNALTFFQQFVKIRTISGEILNPGSGNRGLTLSTELGYRGPVENGFDDGKKAAPVAAAPVAAAEREVVYIDRATGEEVPASEAVPAPKVAKKKAGRPAKKK